MFRDCSLKNASVSVSMLLGRVFKTLWTGDSRDSLYKTAVKELGLSYQKNKDMYFVMSFPYMTRII